MLQQTEQTSRKYRIAAYNQQLHQRQICPANHNVSYGNGWYYLDGEPRRLPAVTSRAKELEEDPTTMVYFNDKMNTYTLSRVNNRTDPPVMVRGEVSV